MMTDDERGKLDGAMWERDRALAALREVVRAVLYVDMLVGPGPVRCGHPPDERVELSKTTEELVRVILATE